MTGNGMKHGIQVERRVLGELLAAALCTPSGADVKLWR